MKGQLTLEELMSFGIYILLISMLISGVYTLRSAGEQWSAKTIQHAKLASFSQTYDAFHNCNLYNPYSTYSGAGRGYVQFEKEISVPVLSGTSEVAIGEAV